MSDYKYGDSIGGSTTGDNTPIFVCVHGKPHTTYCLDCFKAGSTAYPSSIDLIKTMNTPPATFDTVVASGVKHDQEKPDMSLLSSIALVEIAKVMTFGKAKYSAHNWRGGFKWSRVLSAAMRHLVAFIGGEDKDPETGLSHLAHCACCILFLLEFETTKKELDDRFKP